MYCKCSTTQPTKQPTSQPTNQTEYIQYYIYILHRYMIYIYIYIYQEVSQFPASVCQLQLPRALWAKRVWKLHPAHRSWNLRVSVELRRTLAIPSFGGHVVGFDARLAQSARGSCNWHTEAGSCDASWYIYIYIYIYIYL